MNTKLTDEQMHTAFLTIAEEAAQVTFQEFMEDEDAEYIRRFGRAIETAAQAPLLARIAALEAELAAAKVDAECYHWLRDHSVPPHNFYLSVPDEFHGVRYQPQEVDAYIRAAIDAMRKGEQPC